MKKPSARKLPDTVAALPEHSPHEVKQEPNPFVDGDWRMLGYAWSGFALRVLLVVGAVFSAMQYLQNREEKRVERSLQLVEIWERPEYQQAQRALADRLDRLNAENAGIIGSDSSEAEWKVYYSRIGITAMTEEGGAMPLAEFRPHFDRLVYFLNRVSFCVDGNLCDRRVADAFFRDFAVSFWNYFAGYVYRERRGAPNFARPLEDYVERRG